MRVFQQVGCADGLQNLIRPVAGMDLVDRDGHVLYAYRPSATTGALGWAEGFMFQQPVLERLLRSHLAQFPTVRIATGVNVESVVEHDSHDSEETAGASVSYRDAEGALHTVRAQAVVGCDGARSIVRNAITEHRLTALGPDSTWLVVDLEDVDPEALPQMTVQYCDPARPATFVPLPNRCARFELQVMPNDDVAALTTTARVNALLAPWIGPHAYRLVRATVYTFHALLADRWRRGSVLIAGDAAHQMPPFLGQGMGTGIRDAANLAWKLALWYRGEARSSLLDSYEQERAPATRRVIETDLWLGARIQTTNAEAAARRNVDIRRAGGAVPLVPPRFAIGSGLTDGDEPVGLPFPQWVLPSGERSDALLGDLFTLIGPLTPKRRTVHSMQHVGTHFLPAPPRVMQEFLHDHGAIAAIVRPDRVLHALVRSPDEVDHAWELVARHLTTSDELVPA